MTSWNTSGDAPLLASWVTASLRCCTRPQAPVLPELLPAIALMRSIHTPVGWFAIALPPPADAFARQMGLLYTPAPEYGLSTRGPPLLEELLPPWRFTVIDVPV